MIRLYTVVAQSSCLFESFVPLLSHTSCLLSCGTCRLFCTANGAVSFDFSPQTGRCCGTCVVQCQCCTTLVSCIADFLLYEARSLLGCLQAAAAINANAQPQLAPAARINHLRLGWTLHAWTVAAHRTNNRLDSTASEAAETTAQQHFFKHATHCWTTLHTRLKQTTKPKGSASNCTQKLSFRLV